MVVLTNFHHLLTVYHILNDFAISGNLEEAMKAHTPSRRGFQKKVTKKTTEPPQVEANQTDNRQVDEEPANANEEKN